MEQKMGYGVETPHPNSFLGGVQWLAAAVCCSVYNVLGCVAVCCSVLQCVAVCTMYLGVWQHVTARIQRLLALQYCINNDDSAELYVLL